MAISGEKVMELDFLVGSHLFTAKRNLANLGIDNVEIIYREADVKPYTVLDIEEKEGEVWLTIASRNIIQFLPSMYQKGDFLKRFLWIIQHIQNDASLKLDAINEYFNPWLAPAEFIDWVASWFNLDIGSIDDDFKRRQLLANAIKLYRWRGTAYGMEKLLEATTGICPEIHENEFTGEHYYFEGERPVDQIILDIDTKGTFFEVYFPVQAEEIRSDVKSFIHRIVQREKPAHTKAYVTFCKNRKTSEARVINEETTIFDQSGLLI